MFDFDELETLPVEDTPPDGPVCEEDGCDEFVTWVGRGRKPKRCDLHKVRTSSTPRESSGPTPRRSSAKQEKRLAELSDGLMREFAMFGKGMAKLMPTAGGVAVARAEITAQGLTAIAAKNPKLLAMLETSTKILPLMDLGETIGMLGVAIMVDSGRVDPDGMMSTMLGVSEIYHTMNPDDPTPMQPVPYIPNGADLFNVNLPPRFASVS